MSTVLGCLSHFGSLSCFHMAVECIFSFFLLVFEVTAKFHNFDGIHKNENIMVALFPGSLLHFHLTFSVIDSLFRSS